MSAKPILFRDDWYDHTTGRYRATVHKETTNASFRRLSSLYSRMGIANNLFPLAITQKDLIGHDPHNLRDPSIELRLRIAHECQINVWYFLREVVRIPSQGGDAIAFEAHRGNISMAWCFLVGIDYISVQPRQTGKTVGGITLSGWTIYIHGLNMTIGMITKDTKLRQENVARLKEIRDELPSWLVHTQTTDTDNKEGIVYEALNNKYKTFVGLSDKQAAANVSRGEAIPVFHSDEPGFITNFQITHAVMMGAASRASVNAKRNGMPHSHLYTTTAARTDTNTGKFMYGILKKAMPFTEKLYDTKDVDAALKMVRANSLNMKVNGTWSYLQLGKTHEWFVDTVAKVDATDEEIDRDFLNIWRAGLDTSILSTEIIAKLKATQREPDFLEVVHEDYVFSWYVQESIVRSPAFKNKQMILAMDSSELVGRDFTGLVMLDPETMNVVATFRCNESNIIKLGIFVGTLLVIYRNTVFIPERKSTGSTIIDQVIMILEKHGFNPFLRIFNRLVQERDQKPFSDIRLDQPGLNDSTYRKYLGFQTTGVTRPFLYKNVLNKAARQNAERIYDAMIISELSALSTINGRVDHGEGNNDDMAIAYLLACWLVYEGKNLRLYGLDVGAFLRDIPMGATAQSVHQVQEQLHLKKRIQHFEALIAATDSDMVRFHFRQKLNALRAKIVDDAMEPIASDQVREAYRENGDIYAVPGGRPPPQPEITRQRITDAVRIIR